MVNIKKIISEMPQKPGIYIYRDKDKNVIYVGKAKKLKRRVSSYFNKNKNHSPKTIKLVENIRDLEYIVVDTEEEALILECNFIKRYRPKYNILLKDDKSYPYIKLTTNEDYPRLFLTRHKEKDNAKYYGPFPNVTFAKDLIDLFTNRFMLRRCEQSILKQNKRPCLNYDIKLCSSPCTNKISKEDYNKNIKKIIEFFDGNYKELLNELTNEMNEARDTLDFEKAAKLRDEINTLRGLSDEQKITSTDNKNMDIIALSKDKEENKTLVQILTICDGKMQDRRHHLLENIEGESDKEILVDFIKQYYLENPLVPNEIMTEIDLSNDINIDTNEDTNEENNLNLEKLLSEIAHHKVKLITPKIGKNKRLLMLAKSNAEISLLQYKQKSYYKDDVKKQILNELKKILNMDKDIYRIESYDISHISGVDNVGSMVVFLNAEKAPSEYRKFKINDIKKADDIGCMKEILTRRFNRYINDDEKFNHLPDLIMMDGGINQVNACLEILSKLKIKDVTVCGLVKDDKHRTNKIYYNGNEINIDTHSELFKFITRLQDEVHKQAISYFKKLHNKNNLKSILDDIEGIGEKRKIDLYNKFKTIDKIKNATKEELLEVKSMNENVAINIIKYFSEAMEDDNE